MPRVLALDNIGSRADGNDTLLILNRIGGNLATGASTLINLFGILYNDSEVGLSFGFGGASSSPGTCQFRGSLSNAFRASSSDFVASSLACKFGRTDTNNACRRIRQPRSHFVLVDPNPADLEVATT